MKANKISVLIVSATIFMCVAGFLSTEVLAGQTYAQQAASQIRTDNPVCQNMRKQLLNLDQTTAGRSNSPAAVRAYDRTVSRMYAMAQRGRCIKN